MTGSHFIPLFRPKYEGDRFKEHHLPLEVLEDLIVYQKMVEAMARYLFKLENTERERVPRNFNQGISFELVRIDPGSAMPVVGINAPTDGLFPAHYTTYFTKAPDCIALVVESAAQGLDVSSLAPANVLDMFNQFGKNLRENESIDFTPEMGGKSVLRISTRKQIILASSRNKEYIGEVVLFGVISEIDQNKETFTVDLINDMRLGASYSREHYELLIGAFNTFTSERRTKVMIKGAAVLNASDRIQRIHHVEEVVHLEDLDVPYRLEEFALLKPGWLDGEGEKFSIDGLNWLAKCFNEYYPSQWQLPDTIPTPEGHVRFEWSLKKIEASLEVNLSEKMGYYHVLDTSNPNDEGEERYFNLADEVGWRALLEELHKHIN